MDKKVRQRIDELSERKADVIRMLARWTSPPSITLVDSTGSPPKKKPPSNVEEYCSLVPPLEEFLDLSSSSGRSFRTSNFLQDVRKGDILYVSITSKLMSGLNVKLLGTEWAHGARTIDDLGLKAFIPSDHIPSLSHRKDPVDNYELKDLLRAVVLDIHPKEERIVLSISQKDMLENGPKVSLGLVTHEELPKYHRQTLRNPPKAGEDLATYIQKQREFENPGFLDMMRGHLEIPTSATSERWHSLLPGYCGKLILPEDRADQLTMAQSCRWSMKSVEDGVRLMKEGDYAAALEAFNKAVEMNKKNIEALVARGALFVKKEDYNRAIKDFEEALSMNRSHRNARKYLADTFYALGKRFESGEPERALKHYKEALRLDPNFTEAVEAEERLRLGDQDVIEIPIASAKEPEKPKFSTAEKLRRMLRDSSADKDKPSSKRLKRSRSRDDRSSERSRSRRRTPSSERSRKTRSTSGRCVSRSERRSPKRSYVSPVRSKVPQNSNGKYSAPKQEEVRLEKKVERMPTPKVAIDVDEVAAQLEAFRAAKKAQALATNKDIQKKTFR